MAGYRGSNIVPVADYYRDPAVRSRIHEYCGGTNRSGPTAAYLAALHEDGTAFLTWWDAARIAPPRFGEVVRQAPDLSRALWDTADLIFVLDLDHLNIDAEADAFLHPADTFFTLEPVYRATSGVLARFGIHAFSLMTGRGYHFVGRIPLTHPVTAALAGLVPETPSWHGDVEARRPAGVSAELSQGQARAAAGLGLLTEFLAHFVLRAAGPISGVPIVVNGTVVGPGFHGRECVSLDFSHAGDPLDIRTIRVAFGTYQWHRFRPDIFGAAVSTGVPPLAALPRGRHSLAAMLLGGRDLAAGMRMARTRAARMPDISDGIATVLASYRGSPLAAFHREFAERRSGETTPPAGNLPPCVAGAFAAPNDRLLKPEHIQHVVRALMARGWTPRQIADSIAACYAADFNWGDRWASMHRQTRADFDVRVFAGMIVTGLDRMVDFNCASAQGRRLCPGGGCPYDLRADGNRLLAAVARP